jgi:C4-dicarboxylate-binding protein DctP
MIGRLLTVLLVSALSIKAPDAVAQQVKLKASLQFPISHPVFGANLMRLKQEVERETGNALVIEIVDNARLLTDYQVVDGVPAGIVDIGMTAAQQFSYKAPLVGILDQPFLFNFQALMDAAAKPGSEIRTLIDGAILDRIGVRVLWWQSLGNNVLFSKDLDVADPARIKDRRVASPGKLPGEFIDWCGGKAVAMSVEKFQDGFRKGELDMAVVGLTAIRTLGLWQVTDTVTHMHHSPVTFFLVVNENTWQSLSPLHRAIVEQAARRVELQIGGQLRPSQDSARAFANDKGFKFHDLTPDQVADWRACSAGMLADFMERNGEGARKLMDAYGRLRRAPCCSAMPGEGVFTRR